jgi:hypothetical protein
MALLTSQTYMTTRQREVAFVVVKRGIFPIGRGMASGAIGAELAVVFIVLFVAGVTIAGGAFVNPVLMAFFALRFGMLAFELEGGEIVIELGGSPAFCGMAFGAVHAETPFVRFLPAVTGEAVLRKRLQVCNGTRVEVTLCAVHRGMFPSQLEGELVVVEVISVAVCAIVAGETIRAEGKQMRLGEGNVHLTVAGLAGVGGEDRDVAVMTVITGEGRVRCCALVTGQNKSHHLMRK